MIYTHELSQNQTKELSQSAENIGDFVQNSNVLKNHLMEKIQVLNQQIHCLGLRLSIFTTLMDSTNGVTSNLKTDIDKLASCSSFVRLNGNYDVDGWESFLTASQCRNTQILLDALESHRDNTEFLITDLADSIEMVTDILDEYNASIEDLKLTLSDVEKVLIVDS